MADDNESYPAHIILSIETAPIDLEKSIPLDEESRRELINPIDSKIIAIGLRYESRNKLFYGDDEWKILKDFWQEWNDSIPGKGRLQIVGFNISRFDLPFITTRSFVRGVAIIPFSASQVVDLRDKISAHRYGKTRGKLREYGSLIGIKAQEVEPKEIYELYKTNQGEKIKLHLENNLELIDALYKRAVETNIIKLGRW
jgi:hypothetical protein